MSAFENQFITTPPLRLHRRSPISEISRWSVEDVDELLGCRTELPVVTELHDLVDMAGDAGADRNTLPIELRTLNAVGPAASASSSTVAGIDNELLYNPKTAMLFGNTEDSFTKLDAAGWSS